MKIIEFTPANIKLAVKTLHEGGTVIHATETCYGIACDLTNPKAVANLFKLKRRPIHQSVSALFADLEIAKQYAVFSEFAEEIAKKYLPGPLTIILPHGLMTPHSLHLTADEKVPVTVGIRISSHPVALELTKAFGRPIATTSANLHGETEVYSVEELTEQHGKDAEVDLVLDSGKLAKTPPSTVIEIKDDHVTVLRQGKIKL
jgi:L-threonylcarbamoyladenylate synthase